MSYERYLKSVSKMKLDSHVPDSKDEVVLKVKLLNGRKAKLIVPYDHTVNSIRQKLYERKHAMRQNSFNLVFRGKIMNSDELIRNFKPHLKDYSQIMCVSLPDICKDQPMRKYETKRS